MLELTLKELIGNKFYYMDAKSMTVMSGKCMGVNVTDSGYLTLKLKGKTSQYHDYKNVHISKASAMIWLNEQQPIVEQANAIQKESNELVDSLRKQIIGEPYLT
jgi:hypothetical protein